MVALVTKDATVVSLLTTLNSLPSFMTTFKGAVIVVIATGPAKATPALLANVMT